MIRALIITIAMLAGSLSSAFGYSVLDKIEDAYEVPLGVVTLPSSSAGSVIFTTCETCRTNSLRVTDTTRYLVNGAPVALEDLNEVASGLRATATGRDLTAVVVFYDARSLRVTRIALSYQNQ
jgi:hypothetical protein